MNETRAAFIALATPALLTVRIAVGQCVEECTATHTFLGEVAGDQFGWKSNGLGDLNGDNVNDFVVTAPTNDGGGLNAGRAYVYSGADGTELFRITGGGANWQLGIDANAAGDVNGDCVPDVIAGAPIAGSGRAVATVHALGRRGVCVAARSDRCRAPCPLFDRQPARRPADPGRRRARTWRRRRARTAGPRER